MRLTLITKILFPEDSTISQIKRDRQIVERNKSLLAWIFFINGKGPNGEIEENYPIVYFDREGQLYEDANFSAERYRCKLALSRFDHERRIKHDFNHEWELPRNLTKSIEEFERDFYIREKKFKANILREFNSPCLH